MGNNTSEVTEPLSKSSEEVKNGKNESFVKIRKGKLLSDSHLVQKERAMYFQKISESKEKQKKLNHSFAENINISESNKLSTIEVKASSISAKSKTFQIPLQSTLKHNHSHILLSDNSSNLLRKSKIERKMSYDFDNVTAKGEFENTFYENMAKIRHLSYDEGLPSEKIELCLEKNDDNQETNLNCSALEPAFLNSSNMYDFELKLFKRGEDLRRSYISKLISTKIWQPSKKEKKHNTMIIFDWDDTLLCTSYLTPTGIFNEDFELSEKDKEKIAKLEHFVVKIINLAIAKGDTYIITNAAPGWVEYSAERFYPEVKAILHKVTIVSARGEYEKLYPGDSRQWKIQAFLEMKKNFETDLVANIICMGDSIIEMEAAHVLASKFSQAFIKTIKFREAPKPEELVKQLSLVSEQFSTIYSSVKNLTIRVERKGNK
jgi:hypothetical protein